MKIVLIVALTILMASALSSQTSGKPAITAAGLGKQEALSNEEMNIRAYIELLRTDIRTCKSQIVADVMALDATEAAKFWPIYQEFEEEYKGLGDRILALVIKYAQEYSEM